MKKKYTYKQCLAADVRLKGLHNKIKIHAYYYKLHPSGYCANHFWYGKFRQVLIEIWTWHRDMKTNIGRIETYDMLYDNMYKLLPNCSHQGCCK